MRIQSPFELNLQNLILISRNWVLIKALMMLFLLVSLSLTNANAQDNQNNMNHFRGNISVTNNGLSLIPAFSLNRPAAIFELSLGGEPSGFLQVKFPLGIRLTTRQLLASYIWRVEV